MTVWSGFTWIPAAAAGEGRTIRLAMISTTVSAAARTTLVGIDVSLRRAAFPIGLAARDGCPARVHGPPDNAGQCRLPHGGVMGRKERPVDPAGGPLQRFAWELRQLREAAGRPTYRSLAAKVHYSASMLAEAAGGREMPSD